MSFFKKALCAAVVSGLVASSPAMAAPKVAAPKVAANDVRASSKVRKAQRAIGAETLAIVLIGGAAVVAGVAAATAGSK